jgi:hypothetical protein
MLLTLHAALGVAALALLPHRWSPERIASWSDTFVPAFAAGALGFVLVTFVFFGRASGLVGLALAAVAAGWAGATVCGKVLFPASISFERAVGPAAVALALATLAWAARARGRRLASAGAAVLGATLGGVVVAGQRAPDPSTRPSGGALATVKGEPTNDDATSGQVSFPCGKGEHVRVAPLLTFERRSPDRTWAALAPSDDGPRRRMDAFVREAKGFRAHYLDDGASTLLATKDAKGLDVEAMTELPAPVFSDRAAFALVRVPFAAWVALSPTRKERFDGDPETVAHLEADGTFRVEEGGTPRAKGLLDRAAPLTLEVGHAGAASASCRITLKDWAAQASTEEDLGVPEDRIEITARPSGAGTGELVVVFSLAQPVGRGFPRTVGHADGVYADRIRVDTTMDPARIQ